MGACMSSQGGDEFEDRRRSAKASPHGGKRGGRVYGDESPRRILVAPPPSGQLGPTRRGVPLPRPPNSGSGSMGKASDRYSSASDRSAQSRASSEGIPSDLSNSSAEKAERFRLDIRSFILQELEEATQNFRADLELGEGGFGKVFLGVIDEGVNGGRGTKVAVKRRSPGSQQGHKEWMTELKLLSELRHPRLVNLLGYCLDDTAGECSLVYEYLSKGSLEFPLFGVEEGDEPLSWTIRVRIALQVAEGLAYLHEDTHHQQVIYRDFKASNILLDDDYNAKLSDFGLARETTKPAGVTHVTTTVMGTYGYTAPEYLMKGHLSARSDVYSFGVVLLEIITGLMAVDKTRAPKQHNLVQWAHPYLTENRRIYKIIDPLLEGNYSIKAAKAAADVALKCLNHDPRQRPTMAQVVELLRVVTGYTDNAGVGRVTAKNESGDEASQ